MAATKRKAKTPARATLMIRDQCGRYRPATGEQILASARRTLDKQLGRRPLMTDHLMAAKFLRLRISSFEHEVFGVMFLDTRHRLIRYESLFRGTIDGAAVYPREIVKQAMRLNAAAVILAHNHPSGDCEPSDADQSITRRVSAALRLVDVRLLDHIVVGGLGYTSFAAMGLMKAE